MCWEVVIPTVVGLGSSYAGAQSQENAARRGGRALERATAQQLGYLTESRNLALALSDPARQAGYASTAAMMDMMGLPRTAPESAIPTTNLPAATYGAEQYSDLPTLRKRKSGSYATLSRHTHKRRKKYAKELEAYLGEHMPEGIWQGRGGRTRPRKGAKRKRWRQYGEALLPYAQALSEERAAEAAGQMYLPPGVTAPNLAGYEQYEWQADPGYQFRVDEGMRALEASASAKGGLLAGGTLRDITTFGQDMASQEYMNIYNRLATLAGYGQTGVNTGVGAIMSAGGYGANILGEAGASRASMYTAVGNAGAGFWGDAASVLGNMPWEQWLNRSRPAQSTQGYATRPTTTGRMF